MSLKDPSGTIYTPPGPPTTTPPPAGTYVTVHTSNGDQLGTMQGGHAVVLPNPNK
jgi:hypothetical protein